MALLETIGEIRLSTPHQDTYGARRVVGLAAFVLIAVGAASASAADSRAGNPAASAGRIAFEQSALAMASKSEGARLHVLDDGWKKVLSPLDRQVVSVPAKPIPVSALDGSLRTLALNWTPKEVALQTRYANQAVALMRKAGIRVALPKIVNIVENDPALYSGSAYTRGTTVFTPVPLEVTVLVHELWHIVSGSHPPTSSRRPTASSGIGLAA